MLYDEKCLSARYPHASQSVFTQRTRVKYHLAIIIINRLRYYAIICKIALQIAYLIY